MSETDEFYSLAPLDNKGNKFPFEQLRGKVVLVVNVASQCSFSRQYFMLEQLYEKYHDQGFVVIAVPCNQFGNQEPGSDEQIAEFCRVNFNVKFPLMKKAEVNGSDTIPLYNYLKNKKKGTLGFSGIKWNFEKFLVGRDGSVLKRWASTATPQALEPFIVKALEGSPQFNDYNEHPKYIIFCALMGLNEMLKGFGESVRKLARIKQMK